MRPATRNGSGIRETKAQVVKSDSASRVEQPNLSKNTGLSPETVLIFRKGPKDLIRSHLCLQSEKCVDRALLTELLFGRDPMTTIVGDLELS